MRRHACSFRACSIVVGGIAFSEKVVDGMAAAGVVVSAMLGRRDLIARFSLGDD